MSARKSFVYLVRRDGDRPRLLVFESLDEPGLEVPKGGLEAGETYEDAAVREVREEVGIVGIRVLGDLGAARYEGEEQHFLLAEAPSELPESFEHTVTGEGADAGFRYVFRWEPIDSDLEAKLVQGSGAFVERLVEEVTRPERSLH
jgi:8-oxo-dGTP pyrophosphatase MutT (NUDIX family)